MSRHCSKEEIGIADEHMKRCLTVLVIKEMQNEATVGHHFTHTAAAAAAKSLVWKKSQQYQASERIRSNWNLPIPLVGMQMSIDTLENSLAVS